jgi:hypothetical protein
MEHKFKIGDRVFVKSLQLFGDVVVVDEEKPSPYLVKLCTLSSRIYHHYTVESDLEKDLKDKYVKFEDVFVEDAEVEELDDITFTLMQRGDRYGNFEGISTLSQKLLSICLGHSSTLGKNLSDVHREALTMICHKMARICNGDPDYDDSWRDIAGYATLVVKHLNGEGV